MQPSPQWKPAANLELLLGTQHPVARITKSNTNESQSGGESAVNARNCVKFRGTMYCNRQDCNYINTRRCLVEYYRFMLSKVDLWEGEDDTTTLSKGEENKDIKQEDEDEVPPPKLPSDMVLYRARGILTQLCSPLASGEELLLPWEFFPITDIDDDDAYVAPIRAMTKDVTTKGGYLQTQNEDADDGATAGAITEAGSGVGGSGLHGRLQTMPNLSLYTRLVPQFTGLYSGMVVGIAGDPFKRSSSGVLTAVLVRRFILPSRPQFPWGIERPLPNSASHSPIPTRVHFCSGPFPRRETGQILSSVTLHALHRGADLLIIGGPLVREFEDFEKDSLKLLKLTFDELLSSYIDVIEEVMEKHYTESRNPRSRNRMKVVLVSHRDDVTQIPAIPTTMYSLESTDNIWVRSNPCRISVNGIHIGVCNDDVVGDMRQRMVERWPTESGSLRRVVETVVQSRLYAPLFEFPATKQDLHLLGALRLDTLPEKSEDVSADREAKASMLSWDSLQFFCTSSDTKTDDSTEQELKRVKQEDSGRPSDTAGTISTLNEGTTVEWMPHLLFLPSARPRFAFVTHRRGETAIDDVTTASGVMVVNQEVWCRRTSPRFDLRVAEVTVEDSERVVRYGASERTGVVCGIIHFSNVSTDA